MIYQTITFWLFTTWIPAPTSNEELPAGISPLNFTTPAISQITTCIGCSAVSRIRPFSARTSKLYSGTMISSLSVATEERRLKLATLAVVAASASK